MKKAGIISALLALCLGASMTATAVAGPKRALDVGSDPLLKKHSAEFKKQIIKVVGGVYVAVGYGLANVCLIKGKDGLIIIDTMESMTSAKPVKAEFDKISKLPVKAIIYTHFHADHVYGASVFAGKAKPMVISHALTPYFLDRVANILRPIIYKRAMRMFGVYLPRGGVVNAGIGPRLVFDKMTRIGLVRPTKTFKDKLEITIAGVKLVLIHAPGETPDQIVVWLPDKKVLFAADNFYKAFPNLYTIRGTSFRDVRKWAASLDKMRALGAEYLVLGHTLPLKGRKFIFERLTNYRDAIQFVHDQTVRWINRGLTPGQIVKRVKLPPHLAKDPWLIEYYGMVEWSVRSVFNGYLGWYSGRGRDLFPFTHRERARRMAALVGGVGKLVAAAGKALTKGDYRWALSLSDDALLCDPENQAARKIKVAALMAMAKGQRNANARNYLLTLALETKGDLVIAGIKPGTTPASVIYAIPIERFFEGLTVNLNPAKCLDVDMVVGLRFPDLKKGFTVHVRRGVAEVRPVFPRKAALKVTMDSKVFKDLLLGRRNVLATIGGPEVKIEGPPLRFMAFLSYFQSG